MSTYDPLELTEKVRKIVVKGNQRKYYRFRGAQFYGGIATADCVGCNLSCRFCWSKTPRKKPEKAGEFYSPEEVKEKLIDIASDNGYDQVRISGNEPTIGREHLVSLLKELEDSGLKFVLETNGILIGNNPEYAKELERFENLHVRVSLKGCTPEQFERLTGAEREGFELSIDALGNLTENGVSCHPAVMKEFTNGDKLLRLKAILKNVHPHLVDRLEFEGLKLYPHVREQLREAGIEIPEK